ncbi:putative ubiquitin-conjugating enzyme E2 38 [Apium graveolens]|uniref:putative ubiquitin-conjugating enzyme E2 38 n=1 Tax=Apium graveolens TaxID=4045 RepID=UPI003D7B8720
MALIQIHRFMERSQFLMAIMIMILCLITMKLILLSITAIIIFLKTKNIIKDVNLASLNSKAKVMQNYKSFKRFDIVDNFLDHHYCQTWDQPTQAWTKVISNEWKILKKNLPDTIYVRVCERRMDLLRAVIIGAAGTPYHDGLFVFDLRFPPKYPAVPPEVHYHSRGLRINPNLYDCGRVCLSLLNTWTGRGNENWLPNKSTVLQVLVSIQAVVLNEKPFFNEPGYAHTYTGRNGARKSTKYNEQTFILSLKTMLYTIRTPPQHFEDFVHGHFRTRGRAILLACGAYMEGASVGYTVKDESRGSRKAGRRKLEDYKRAINKLMELPGFKRDLGNLMNSLAETLTKLGSKNCAKF